MTDILNDPSRMARVAESLVRAATMTADELAKERGEQNRFVQIKRNGERLNACDGHEFEPAHNWREATFLTRLTVHCPRCNGDMKASDAIVYLRGRAHERGVDPATLLDVVFPKEPVR